jgi:hypothetical protein
MATTPATANRTTRVSQAASLITVAQGGTPSRHAQLSARTVRNLRCEVRDAGIGVSGHCVVHQEIWLEGGYRRAGSLDRARHPTRSRGHLEGAARIGAAKGDGRPPLLLGGCPELGGRDRCRRRRGATPGSALCCGAVGGGSTRATARVRSERFHSGVEPSLISAQTSWWPTGVRPVTTAAHGHRMGRFRFTKRELGALAVRRHPLSRLTYPNESHHRAGRRDASVRRPGMTWAAPA